MEERSSNHDTIFNLLLIIGTIICFLLSLVYYFSPLSTKALTTNDVTNAVYTGGQNTDLPCTTNVNGMCTITERSYGGTGIVENFNTWYGGTGDRLYKFGFQLNTAIASESNITIRVNGNNFKNVNYACTSSHFSCRVVYVDSGQLNINFTNNNSSNITGAVFDIYIANNNGSTFMAGNDLNKFNSVYLLESSISSGSGGSGGSGGSTFDDTGIINNANENTQSIISNNNENTNTIWNEIHGITNELINACPNLLNPNSYFIDPQGKFGFILNLVEGQTYKLTSNVPIYAAKFSGFSYNGAAVSGPELWEDNGFTSWTFTTENSSYRLYLAFSKWNFLDDDLPSNVHLMLTSSNINSSYCPFGSSTNKLDGIEGAIQGGLEENKNAIDDNTQAVQDVNDTLTDDNIDSDLGHGFFNDFDDDDPGGISGIVTRPLIIINSLLENNNQCNHLPLPDIMGATGSYLPSGCEFWNRVPSYGITLWNIFVCGVCSYAIIIDLFKLVNDLKTPTHNKVEVLDL